MRMFGEMFGGVELRLNTGFLSGRENLSAIAKE